MLHGDLAKSARAGKIPSARLVQRTLEGQRSQIEPAPGKSDIAEFFSQQFKTVQQIFRLC